MTGGEAEIGDGVGAHFRLGWLHRRAESRTRAGKIVQTWRTTEFPDNDHPDSTITIEFSAIKAGTRLRLSHRGVPDGQTSYEAHGWREFYFEPMSAFFSRR